MACKKRKAFTLTELLVVVVIIGVLSAVVLPKFTRVIEARKTTEAEEMMAAIRTEQEARCTISKNYQRELNKLASYRAGKNFTYEDLNGVGMVAKAVSGKYTLKMPSYADGRICCAQDDTYCQNLNKNYPKCNELTNFVEGNEDCDAIPPCTDGDVAGSQPCNGCGTRTTQICEGGKWVEQLGTCSKTEEECSSKCQAGTTREVVCKCGVETGQRCKADGSGWEDYTVACALKEGEEDKNAHQNGEEKEKTTGEDGCETIVTYTQFNETSCKWETQETKGECADSTCATVADKYWEEQGIDLSEKCATGINIEDIHWQMPLASNSEQEWVKVCCGCCPSGIYNNGKCVSCEEIGPNFRLDQSQGACGVCVGAFKPQAVTFMAVSAGKRYGTVYADYTETEFRAGNFTDVTITGTPVYYIPKYKACYSCDPKDSTCAERGYTEEARAVLTAWTTEQDEPLQAEWYKPLVRLSALKKGGYKPATYRIAADWTGVGDQYDNQKAKLREWGFIQYGGTQGLIEGSPAMINQGLAKNDFAQLYYFPQHQAVQGYVCTRESLKQ